MNPCNLALCLCATLTVIGCSAARLAVEAREMPRESQREPTDVSLLDAAPDAPSSLDAARALLDVPSIDDAAVVEAVEACASNDGRVVVTLEREFIESECEDEFRNCYVSLGVRVTNCSARPIALRRAQSTDSNGGRIEWSFELSAIAPGASDLRRVRFFDEREDDKSLDVSGGARLIVACTERAQKRRSRTRSTAWSSPLSSTSCARCMVGRMFSTRFFSLMDFHTPRANFAASFSDNFA